MTKKPEPTTDLRMTYMGRRLSSDGRILHVFKHGRDECKYFGIVGCIIGHIYKGQGGKGPNGETQKRMYKKPERLGPPEVSDEEIAKWEAEDLIVKHSLEEENALRRMREDKKLNPVVDLIAPIVKRLSYYDQEAFVKAVVAKAREKARKL